MKGNSQLGSALTGGGFTIAVGFILLLNTSGLLDWGIWLNLFRLWPIVFILFGINIIFSHYGNLASFFGGILNLVILGVVIAISIMGGSFLNPAQITTNLNLTAAEIDSTNATITERNINIVVNAAELILDDQANRLNHIELNATHLDTGDKPSLTSEFNNSVLNINLKDKDAPGLFRIFGKANYIVKIGQVDLLTNLSVEANASSSKIELGALNLQKLDLDTNAANTEVTLKSFSRLPRQINVEANAGNLILRLPTNVKLQVKYEANLGSIKLDSRVLPGEGEYNEDNSTLVLVISANAGNVEIYRNQTDVSGVANEIAELD